MLLPQKNNEHKSNLRSIRSIYEEVWNSDIVKKLRYSVLHGNFEYCNIAYCNMLKNPPAYEKIMLPRNEAQHISKYEKWQDCHLETTPTQIHLACDTSCNMHCASCRDKVHVNSDAENEKLTHLLENFVRPALGDCTLLSCLGSGEFFASKPISNFYQSLSKNIYPALKLVFLSNGTLFTPERWEKLSNLKGMVEKIAISIDAASKDTYESLRRGGQWEPLCRNLEYISSLRKTNYILSSPKVKKAEKITCRKKGNTNKPIAVGKK